MVSGGVTSGGVDLESAIAPWRRRKWLVLSVFAVLCAGAVAVVLFLPDVYKSTATILIERPQVSETFVRSSVTSDLETRLQTIREQILSRDRLWKMIVAHNLYPELREPGAEEAVVQRMRRDVKVEMKGVGQRAEPGSTIALAIGYQGSDPKTVSAVANDLAAQYVAENSKTRERHARGTSEFLRTQLDQAKKQLEAQESRINGFKERHGGELPSGQEAALSALDRLSAQLDRNAEQQARAKERLAMLEREASMPPPPPPPLPDGSQSDEARIARLQTELAELRRSYKEEYPDVAAVKAELAELQSRARGSAGGGPSSPGAADGASSIRPAGSLSSNRIERQRRQAEAELKSLELEARKLQPSIRSYQGRLEQMPRRDLELAQISRDYLTTREQYDSLLKRYSDAALAERVELRSSGEEFEILESAVPAAHPSAPNRQKLVVMAVAFALGLTLFLALVVHRFDGALHSVDEVQSMTTLPILATVPPIVTAGDRARGAARFGIAAVGVVAAMAAAVGSASVIAGGNEDLVRMLSRGGS